MKNKFTKAIAAVLSCAAIISTGLATAAPVSASYKDSDWYAYTSTNGAHSYHRPKDTLTSVYVSNSGKNNNSFKGTCDTLVTVHGQVYSNGNWYSYSCTDNAQNSYSTHFNCSNLRITAYTTRVVYQYIQENFKSACDAYKLSPDSAKCYAEISFKSCKSGTAPYGQWSPDTYGWYPQISGQ